MGRKTLTLGLVVACGICLVVSFRAKAIATGAAEDSHDLKRVRAELARALGTVEELSFALSEREATRARLEKLDDLIDQTVVQIEDAIAQTKARIIREARGSVGAIAREVASEQAVLQAVFSAEAVARSVAEIAGAKAGAAAGKAEGTSVAHEVAAIVAIPAAEDAAVPVAREVAERECKKHFASGEFAAQIRRATVLSVPVGSVVAWPAGAAPKNWAICDGSQFDEAWDTDTLGRVLDPSIYGAHRLPDYRGCFLRAVDPAATLDRDANRRSSHTRWIDVVGPIVGSRQRDALQAHRHDDAGSKLRVVNVEYRRSGVTPGTVRELCEGSGTGKQRIELELRLSDPTGARVSAETRPINVYVNWIIRVR